MKEKSKKVNSRFHRPQKPNADLTFLQIRDIMQITAIITGGVKMGQIDIQFKDNLRKDLITFKHLLKSFWKQTKRTSCKKHLIKRSNVLTQACRINRIKPCF